MRLRGAIGGGKGKSDFGRKHDIIFRYALPGFRFNADEVRIPYEGEGKTRTDISRWGSRRIGDTEAAYTPHLLGKVPEDWWPIPQLNSNAPERVGYPTQKPLKLLDRIIKASSNDGDITLDPFCGCATACIAAEKLNRNWVGIDISPKAAELVKMRMDRDLGTLWPGLHRTDIPKRTDLGRLPRYNSQENRTRLYGEQKGNCVGCGSHFEARHLEVDHIIARQKGGTDHIDNLQLLCGSCNRIKGNRGMEYLKTKLQI